MKLITHLLHEYDYIFANVCRYADIDDYIVRRKLKDNEIKCDYFMENHLMRDLTSTVRIILAERFGCDDEYFENRQSLLVNKEKSEMEREQYMENMYSEAFMEDFLDFESSYEEADNLLYDEEMEADMACAIEAYVKDLVEESMFEVDLVSDILSCVEVNSVEDVKRVTSTEFLKELI